MILTKTRSHDILKCLPEITMILLKTKFHGTLDNLGCHEMLVKFRLFVAECYSTIFEDFL